MMYTLPQFDVKKQPEETQNLNFEKHRESDVNGRADQVHTTTTTKGSDKPVVQMKHVAV